MENNQKTVKATPTTPVYAMFDIIEQGEKQTIAGSIGFKDQFGMERMARCVGEKGILNIGQHVLAIFAGQIDIIEPDDETKAKLAAQDIEETKQAVETKAIKPEGSIQ